MHNIQIISDYEEDTTTSLLDIELSDEINSTEKLKSQNHFLTELLIYYNFFIESLFYLLEDPNHQLSLVI